ncbi:hypothetical protein K438DRAFT_1963738 [Mycena galopus ATCC 62051]|nr:hypothetical protein K438DRAFT_1963738 [Mycena galopus ATCC 62051]
MAYGDIADYPYHLPFPPWPSPFDAPHPQDPPLAPRITLAGSLDPTTGIFYRTPEHPRLRTAQACEKCRARKAKVCPAALVFAVPHKAATVLWRSPILRTLSLARFGVRLREGSTASTHSHSSHSPQHSPTTLPYPTPKKRRRNTALPTLPTVGVKLEPLSSCVPLALPSSSNSRHLNGHDTDLHHPVPLNTSERCLSLSASLSSPHPLNGLATISSSYTPYPDSDSYTGEYTDSAYAYSRRGNFEGLFPTERPRGLKEYDHEELQGYTSHGTRTLDRSDHSAVFPLEAGYARDTPASFTQQYGLVRRGGEQGARALENFCEDRRPIDFPALSDIRLRPASSMADLAMRRASTRSLSGSGSSGSPESVDGGSASAPPSAVTGSFPLFRARWSQSPQAFPSASHIYPPLSSPTPYFAEHQNAVPIHPPYGTRPTSTFPHSPQAPLSTARACGEQIDHSRQQYEPMQEPGPYDAQGRFQLT